MTRLFANLRADIPRYYFGPPPLRVGAALRTVWTQPGFQALAVYRLGRWLNACLRRPLTWPLLLLGPLFWLLQGWVRLAYDIHLDLSADLGAGLYIGHLGGIVLADCRLGRHCAIQQEVHIHGDRQTPRAPGPTIGDRVWIGAHARLVGPLQIGDEATIGAGAVVTSDVAARCLVLGDPARTVRWDFDNSEFL